MAGEELLGQRDALARHEGPRIERLGAARDTRSIAAAASGETDTLNGLFVAVKTDSAPPTVLPSALPVT